MFSAVRPHVSDFANKSQNEGQPVSIECKARGNPPPSFEFTKEGREKPFELGDSSEVCFRFYFVSLTSSDVSCRLLRH